MGAPSFLPGDLVECRDAGVLRWLGIVPTGIPSGLEKGRVYTVAGMGAEPRAPIYRLLVALRDARRADGGFGWNPRRFRLVLRPREGAFDHLLTPIDERVLT